MLTAMEAKERSNKLIQEVLIRHKRHINVLIEEAIRRHETQISVNIPIALIDGLGLHIRKLGYTVSHNGDGRLHVRW